MKMVKFGNGIIVIACPAGADSIALQVTVRAGSNHESHNTRGISHFVEHLLFEGTKSRTGQEIASAIEGLGGEIGGFTTNTRTAFYIKVLKRHFAEGAKVLADILTEPLFDAEAIEKERKIILSEIRMRHDEPRSYQWEILQKRLFRNHNARYPIIGNSSSVEKMTKEDIVSYFRNYYSGRNMIITIAGDISEMHISIIRKLFGKIPSGTLSRFPVMADTLQKKNNFIKEKRDTQHSYLAIGYRGLSRDNKDSYTFDVIRGILGRPLSGRLFRLLRQQMALCYDVGAHNEAEIGYGFFALYISTEKKNLALSKKILLEQLSIVDNISSKELIEAKNYLEGEHILQLEDTWRKVDETGYWEYAASAKKAEEYISKIKKVTKKDIGRIKRKYLKNYTVAIIEQNK